MHSDRDEPILQSERAEWTSLSGLYDGRSLREQHADAAAALLRPQRAYCGNLSFLCDQRALHGASAMHPGQQQQYLPDALHLGRRLRKPNDEPRVQRRDDDVRAMSEQHALRRHPERACLRR